MDEKCIPPKGSAKKDSCGRCKPRLLRPVQIYDLQSFVLQEANPEENSENGSLKDCEGQGTNEECPFCAVLEAPNVRDLDYSLKLWTPSAEDLQDGSSLGTKAIHLEHLHRHMMRGEPVVVRDCLKGSKVCTYTLESRLHA